MNRTKRHGKPRLPEFPPIERLVVGQAFNPYKLFEYYSVRQRIFADPKLRPGAKLVWMLLADQCAKNDYDKHSQGNLAAFLSLSRAQFKRHLGVLVKRKLAHVEPNLGKQNFTWLLFHPLFAGCSPLTPRINELGGGAEMHQGGGHKRATQRIDQRIDAETGTPTFAEATSYSGVPAVRGEQKVNGEDHGEDSPEGPITDSPFTPRVNVQRTPGWYSLSDVEKRNRYEQIDRLARELEYFAEHMKSPDKNIRRQARHEVERRLGQLIARGAVERPVKWKGEP